MIKGNIVFIGSGNMGRAMIKGMISSGKVAGEQITATAKTGSHFSEISSLGVHTTKDNRKAAAIADILFLAVKPGMYPEVIEEIKEVVRPEAVIVILAAGQTLCGVQKLFGKGRKLVKLMPNTPAMVGEAMSALCKNGLVTSEELEEIKELSKTFGKVEEVPESLMDAVTGVSGSSPAYVYLFIEALADGAVFSGMPRSQAYLFAAQSVLGAAKMVLETGEHPGALKDAVCSPGGTTIEAVAKLEEKGLRSAVIEAEMACVEKSRAMTE